MTKLQNNIASTVMITMVVLCGMPCAGASQTTQSAQLNRDELVSRLNSEDVNQRSKAAYEIINMFYHAGVVIQEAVPGFIKELERIDFAHLSEESGEYSGELIYILGEYRDKRAIPALLRGLGFVGGTSVTESYAKMGPDLLDALFEKVKNDSSSVRIVALSYIGRLPRVMIRYGYTISTDQKRNIKELLLSNLKDSDPALRDSAITAIDDIQSLYDKADLVAFIGSLEFISKNDTHRDKIQKDVFPVRINATRVINNLKAR